MASKTLILRNPNFLSHHNSTTLSLHSPPKPFHLSKPRTLSLLSSPILSLSKPRPSILKPTPKISRVFAYSPSFTIPNNSSTDSSENPTHSLLSGSTQTISTISNVFNLTYSKLKSISANPSSEELATIQKLHGNLVCTVGPLFFAALKDRPSPSGFLELFSATLEVVASVMSILLDVYSQVLLVWIWLAFFPNIQWDRQPFSAIRYLCDPYLKFFRKIIPPIFNIMDVSPLLAYAVLGFLGSILKNIRGADGVSLTFLMIGRPSSW